GDSRCLDDFFAEAERRRRRDRALELVDGTESVSPEVRRTLHEAMEGSETLAAIERRAMHLAAAARGVPEESLPDALRAAPLSAHDEALTAAEKENLAIRLLFDDGYFRTKSEIWDNVNEFLDRSMEDELETTRREIGAAQVHAADQTRIVSLRLAVLLLLFALAFGAAFAVVDGKNRASLRLVGALRRERDATLAAEKAKSMFFSMASHDIRTPLNSIVGFSEILVAGGCGEKERAECAENILFSARTLLALVNDVLDLSKLDADKMTVSPVPCDFGVMLSRVAGSFRIQTGAKGISVSAEAGPMPRLMIDEDRVRQILVNLAGNAVKFTEKGGVSLRADFEPDAGGASGTLRFSVSDTGIGIAPEDQARILEPFVQVGPAGIGGTGLGLTICRRLLERMGGGLSVESEPGKGSRFTATMRGVAVAPAAPVAAPAPAPAPAAPAPADPAAPAAPPEPASGRIRSVLVVDDVPVNLLVEKAMLRKAGVERVETAASAAAALDALRGGGEPFDVVLTDLWMPEMDGYGLCAEIRADPALAAQRVCAVTADVEARKTVLSRGFDAVLLKPVTTEVLAAFLGAESARAEAGPPAQAG
ncbi:MAG: response regulator, partial [Kiritimatiellae bacterium]|nr:response regulator [Kiritimatiellia bacterium]